LSIFSLRPGFAEECFVEDNMKNYLLILRPAHWSKNFFVFAGLVFSGRLFGPVDQVLLSVGRAIGAFFSFCLAASAIYIFNDIIDRRTDGLHPDKCKRPIAAGTVSVNSAIVVSALCAAIAVIGSFVLARNFAFVILAYLILMIFYSLVFKRMLILDCVIISIGFCLRALAGAVVLSVFISPWLIICTFALCLFLAFSKRRGEIILLGESSDSFRQTLAGYTPELLSHMLDVTSGLAVVCFLLYAMDDRTLRTFGTHNLVYTTPLVLYCIFRFSLLIQQGIYSDILQLMYKDLPFQIGLVLWVLSCIVIIYADKLGFGGT
jgi:4-hydroxybenzoate polyprenyltransferase